MDRLRLVLVGVEGAINLGMIARLVENFSVEELYIVSPVASIEEALQYAAKATDRLREAHIVSSLEEALDGVSLSICTSALASREDILRIPVKPQEAAELAASVKGTVALVMGRESVGLTRLEISKCTILATIEASSKYPELNLSNATAIMLYELFKVRGKPHYAEEPADSTLIGLIEAYARSLAELLLADKRRVEEVALAFRRVAAKNIIHRKEAENIVLILSKAYRRLSKCKVEPRS